MTPQEREKMNELSDRIMNEKNPEIIAKLVSELNDLVERTNAQNDQVDQS